MTAATVFLRGPLRPRRRLGALLITGALSAFAAAWWAFPALAPPAYGPAPALSQPRLIEMKAAGVYTARIRGLDVSASSGDTTATLVGGYVDAERIALFLRFDPPARAAPARVTLRDQLGRVYHVTGAFADVDTGENILRFDGPGVPLAMAGLRLSLEIDEIERGRSLEPQPARLAISAVLVGHDEWNGYALNMAINYAVLAVAGVVYVGLMVAALWLARGSRRPGTAFARGLAGGVAFAVLALPTYIAIAALFRHDPPWPGGLQRPVDDYVPASIVAFFAIESVAVVVAVALASQATHSPDTDPGASGRAWVPLAAGLAVLGFLVVTLPLAEFANACYVGTGFILRPQC